MPNRPLRRGENLLDLWDYSPATNAKKVKKGRGGAANPADIELQIAPQKANQWVS